MTRKLHTRLDGTSTPGNTPMFALRLRTDERQRLAAEAQRRGVNESEVLRAFIATLPPIGTAEAS